MRVRNDVTTLEMMGAPASVLSPSLVEQTSHCVALINRLGRIETASDPLVKSMGLDDDSQLIGRHWCKTWPSFSHPPLAEAMTRALNGEIITYWAQYPNSQGDMVDWDVRLSPVFCEQGNVTAVLAVSRPLTMH